MFTKNEIKGRKCQSKDFEQITNTTTNYFTPGNNFSYCFDLDDSEIAGSRTNTAGTSFYIQFTMCQNGPDCAERSEIMRWLNDYVIVMAV